MNKARALLEREWNLWRDLQIPGKYIIVYASLLSFVWSFLLFTSENASNATPVHILYVVFRGRFQAGTLLLVAAVMSVAFLRATADGRRGLTWMLLPQQLILLLCAIAGIVAAYRGHYADGVMRPWPFILADQLPVILAALLFTSAALESAVDE